MPSDGDGGNALCPNACSPAGGQPAPRRGWLRAAPAGTQRGGTALAAELLNVSAATIRILTVQFQVK